MDSSAQELQSKMKTEKKAKWNKKELRKEHSTVSLPLGTLGN